jgi:hypothetical protein
MYTISTLHDLRQRLGLDEGADDERLWVALQAASVLVERMTGRTFTPHVGTRDHSVHRIDPSVLLLDDDLLEIDSFTTNDGNDIPTSDVMLVPPREPAGLLLLINGRALTWQDTPIGAATVGGVWGWHDDWSKAWRMSGDSVQDIALSESDAEISVSDANAADSLNEAPRFQVGHLLKISDEYLRVLGVTINAMSDDMLTVQRGVNGTTATAHAQSTPIFTYQPPADIDALVLRFAGWLYKEPDQRAGGIIPASIARQIESLRRISVKA